MSNLPILPDVKAQFTYGIININYEELDAYVDAIVQRFKDVVVTEADYADFKKIRAELNKILDAISKERIRIKKDFNRPVTEMEARLNGLSSYLNEAVSNVDGQLKYIESMRRIEKKKLIESIFDTMRYEDVRLDQIYNPKWENEGYNIVDIQRELHDTMNRIIEDYKTISLMTDQEKALARPYYAECLDILRTQSYVRDMTHVLNVASNTEAEPVQSDGFILGMKVKMEATGYKSSEGDQVFPNPYETADLLTATFEQEHPFIIGFETVDEFTRACIELAKAGIPFGVKD